MKVLILAAGYGTRLYPYTKNFPKCLLTIGQKPIIQYLVEKLGGADCSKIIVVTNARFYRHFQLWQKTCGDSRVTIVNDGTRTPQDRLGAIGDMGLVFRREGAREDFLVLGGDNFFEEPLEGFIKESCRRKKSVTIGVFRLKRRADARSYGVVELDARKKVVGFEEKPLRPRSDLIGMCLYYFPKASIRHLKEYLADRANTKDTIGSYIRWLSKSGGMHGFVFKHQWFDIGSVKTYREAQQTEKGART
jgi:glucose-1-phosphate thymidylyltransferase